MAFGGFFEKGPVRLQSVPIGPKTISIPCAEIEGSEPGKTLLITAGMDGDEYAGIEAAYALIDRYKDGDFAGRLLILPIVNIPGFEAGTSYNPLDGMYPKYIAPGSADGSASAQLTHWVMRYANIADAWLDLHAGSLQEHMLPLIWSFDTGNAQVDELRDRFVRSSGCRTVVIEPALKGQPAHYMGQRGALYALTESGERGTRTQEDVQQHLGWVQALMGELGMIGKTPVEQEPTIVRTISYVYAPYDGIFRPAELPHAAIKGAVLGAYCKYDNSARTEVVAPAAGLVIWGKTGMSMKKGDVLCAIAS